MARYKIRFFFDWHCTPFWSGNTAASERFGYPIQPESLPLSPESVQRSYELSTWYDGALNKDYPPDPGPWRQDECEKFNAAVSQFFELVRTELGEEFELVNDQAELKEDPNLESYLKNPKGFQRPNNPA